MSWLEDIVSSIKYMENHLTDELSVDKVASSVNLSPFYFQKGFAILCGVTVTEYIRNRRLSLAGRDLQIDGCKVIDVAMKYGYDSPDSFAKAFTRFHGITPVQAKRGEGELQNYLPLKIHVSMKGGFEKGDGEFVQGMYGICLDDVTAEGTFKYLIADDYLPAKEVPERFEKSCYSGEYLGSVPVQGTNAASNAESV